MPEGYGGTAQLARGLPIRVHELLLSLAGRLDDDALGEARALVAYAEFDRALEMIVGCLVAGRVGLTEQERAELATLADVVHCDTRPLSRLGIAERLPRHRFAPGDADHGVQPAVRQVVEVLPDIRGVAAVWRLTPAGAATGPVPARVIL